MKKRGFTLTEIVIAAVVIVIVATISIPTYQTIVEKSKQKVCESNLNLLKSALDVYVMENDAMPASLSYLPVEYIKHAHEKSLGSKGTWKVRFAQFILSFDKRNAVYAEPFVNKLAEGNKKIISCPNDPTPPDKGGISYGVNSSLAGITYREYRALSGSTILIGDCERATFRNERELSDRHVKPGIFSRTVYAQSVSKTGEIEKKKIRKKKQRKQKDVIYETQENVTSSGDDDDDDSGKGKGKGRGKDNKHQ